MFIQLGFTETYVVALGGSQGHTRDLEHSLSLRATPRSAARHSGSRRCQLPAMLPEAGMVLVEEDETLNLHPRSAHRLLPSHLGALRCLCPKLQEPSLLGSPFLAPIGQHCESKTLQNPMLKACVKTRVCVCVCPAYPTSH